MGLKTNLLLLLIDFSLINQNFSALFFTPEYKTVADDYTNTRRESNYRGLLLSFSPAKKKELCADLFNGQLYLTPDHGKNVAPGKEDLEGGKGQQPEFRTQNPKSEVSDPELDAVVSRGGEDDRSDKYITDGLQTEGDPQFPLIVAKLALYRPDQDFLQKQEIFFRCVGQNFDHRDLFGFNDYHVSSAFRPGWWNANIFDKEVYTDHIVLTSYVNASPKHVPLKQEELEEQYASTRQIINALAAESPEYVHLIEAQNDLSGLKKWQQLHVCASALSSPTYRIDRLEYSAKWVDNKDNHAVEEKSLASKNEKYKKAFENLKSRCILCKGFENGDDENSPSTNLYLTTTYDDKASMYISKEEAEGIFLSKYFTKVPILLNAREPIAQMELFKNHD